MLEIRVLNKEEFKMHLPSFNKLFESAFGKEIHPDFFDWRYLQNPEDDLLVAVAMVNNEIVANYSASPLRLKWAGHIYKTALSMTTMTHPEHQGKGLFPLLANTLYDEMKNRNFSGIWGFPNNNSHGPFVKKLNWKDVYEIPNFTLSIKNLDYVVLNDEFEIEQDTDYQRISEYKKENGSKIEVVKNLEYYRWRYANHPFNDYQGFVVTNNGLVCGYVILKVFNNSVDLLELECREKGCADALVDFLINYCLDHKLESINSWLNLFGELHIALEKRGFVNHTPLTYFGFKTLCSDKLLSYDYKDWNIQMGDSDVY